MANQTPKTNGPRQTQFLPFHPHQPKLPSIKQKKIDNRLHPYPPLASNVVNKQAIVSQNIKGILFDPNQCLTPLPKQSHDDINWQIKWMDQLDAVKKECQAKEEQLNKVIAHKNAEIGKQKLMLKTQADSLKQKEDEIDKYKLKYKAKHVVLKQKSAEAERFQLESKAKDEIIDQKTAEAEQYKLKCNELAEIIEANSKQFQLESKAKDDIVDRNAAEAHQYKSKCNELAEMVKRKMDEVEQLHSESKAKDDIVNRNAAEAHQYKLKCNKLAEMVKQKMDEVEQFKLQSKAKDETGIQNQNTAEPNYNATKCPTNYRCPKCLKYFNKKSSLNDHLTETICAGEKKLDFKCEICEKMYTHRGLVRHLEQFLTNKHTPRGPHAKVGMEYIQTLLNSHKSKKK